MNSSFRKRMIVTAIATVLAAPAWAASVATDDPARARTGAQAGSEQKSSTASTTGSGTTGASTAYGATSGTAGAGMTGSMGAGMPMAGSASTSHAMDGARARADNPLYGHSVDNLLGADIVGAAGEEIGDIEHVVLTRDRRTAHAVVSVGGFLGIADHDIAVSLDELEPAGDDKWRLNATKEQLEARPKYASDQYLELEGDQPISGWITDFAAFDMDRNRTTGTSRASEANMATTAALATGSSSRKMDVRNARADNPLYSRTVDNLIGADIVDSTGDDIGEVEKVVLTRDRRTAHAVVSVGGFLGIGEHDIAVSLDELTPAGDDKWQLNATKEQLEARPEYQSDQFVELDGDQPISGSITDFAAFETDRNRTMDNDRNLLEPSTGRDATDRTGATSGSAERK